MKTAIASVTLTAKWLSCAAAMLALAACAGTKSNAVMELTKYDKHMSCEELQLEMTEAQFMLDKAEKNRGMNLKNVLMPLSYPSTYFSADNAVEASTNRLDYLSRLFEIKACDSQRMASAAPMPGYEPAMAPMPPSPGMYQEMRYAAPQPVAQPQYVRPYGY